jgi:hypothetical protein
MEEKLRNLPLSKRAPISVVRLITFTQLHTKNE